MTGLSIPQKQLHRKWPHGVVRIPRRVPHETTYYPRAVFEVGVAGDGVADAVDPGGGHADEGVFASVGETDEFVAVVVVVAESVAAVVVVVVVVHVHLGEAAGEGFVLVFLVAAHVHFFFVGEVAGSMAIGMGSAGPFIEETLFFGQICREPGALAGLPFGAAEDAEFVEAGGWAPHVVTAFGAFDCHAAFAAILPAVLFGGLDEGCCFGVVGTLFLVGMVFAVALGADFSVALGALAVDLAALAVDFDVLGLDPCSTALVRAIQSIFGGPFGVLGVPAFLEFALIQMHSHLGLDGSVTAAFGRHVLNIGGAEIENSF